jgi:hypothetical protein
MAIVIAGVYRAILSVGKNYCPFKWVKPSCPGTLSQVKLDSINGRFHKEVMCSFDPSHHFFGTDSTPEKVAKVKVLQPQLDNWRKRWDEFGLEARAKRFKESEKEWFRFSKKA